MDRTTCGAERICGADLNGDNLRINNPICGSAITVGLRLGLGLLVRVRNMVWVRISIRVRVSVSVGVADCCVQTAGESDKMRINHVIKTDQWRSAPQIRPARHFVVSLL